MAIYRPFPHAVRASYARCAVSLWVLPLADLRSSRRPMLDFIFQLKGSDRRRGSQGRVFATGKRRDTLGFIRATPLSENPQAAALSLIARPERSTPIS